MSARPSVTSLAAPEFNFTKLKDGVFYGCRTAIIRFSKCLDPRLETKKPDLGLVRRDCFFFRDVSTWLAHVRPAVCFLYGHSNFAEAY